MSGICGIVRFDGKSVKKEEIQNMLDSMPNKHGDIEGLWVEDNVGFGHKMLWVTPESLYENQPLINQDINLVLTADARIDNREELIENLEINEDDYEVVTDIDLIINSYEKWGENCAKYLYGDFAFAIWDKKKQKIFFARDRIGIRQLYYYYNNEVLIFSTSIEPLFSLGILNNTIDMKSVKKYFKLRSLDRDESFFEDIRRLPSSTWISISENQFEIKRYWFPEKIKTDQTMSLKEATEKFSLLFDAAIRSCLRSSYPVSVEVSGGVDSSSIYSVAISKNISESLTAHTMQHKDLPSDETYYIEALEKKFNTKIQKFDINNIDFATYDLSYFYSKYPDWPGKGNFIEFVMKNKRLKNQGIRVILTGIGADEILGGSDSYMLQYFRNGKFNPLYNELQCIGRRAKSKLTYIKYLMSLSRLIIDPLKHNIKKNIKYGLSKIPLKNNRYKETLYLTEIKLDKKIKNYYIATEGLYLLSSRFSYWMDFNAMQNYSDDGIEVRHPFFDTKLVEFIISLPPEYLYHCGKYKSILKLAMDGILPDEIFNRNNKTCLGPGIKLQMKKMLNDEMLNCSYCIENKFVEKTKIDDYKNKYISGIISVSEFVDYWSIINIEFWLNRKGKL